MIKWPLSQNIRGSVNLTPVDDVQIFRRIDRKATFNTDFVGLTNSSVLFNEIIPFFNGYLRSCKISFWFENHEGLSPFGESPLFVLKKEYLGFFRGIEISYNPSLGIHLYMANDSTWPIIDAAYPLDFGDPSEFGGPSTGIGGEGQYIPYRKHYVELILNENTVSDTISVKLYVDSVLLLDNEIDRQPLTEYTSNYEFFIGARSTTEPLAQYHVGKIWDVKVENFGKKTVKNIKNYLEPRKFVLGKYNEGRTLYINSSSVAMSESYRDLFIYGTVLSYYNTNRTLYMRGDIGDGFVPDAGLETTLYISGSLIETDDRTLFIEGSPFFIENTLFIEGADNTFATSRDLYIYGGSNFVESSRDLFIQASKHEVGFTLFLKNDSSNNFTSENILYISGTNSYLYDIGAPLFIMNEQEQSISYKTMFIKGTGENGDAMPYNTTCILYMARDVEAWGVPLFMGSSTTNDTHESPMYISGISNIQATTTLVIPNVSLPAVDRTLYIRGR